MSSSFALTLVIAMQAPPTPTPLAQSAASMYAEAGRLLRDADDDATTYWTALMEIEQAISIGSGGSGVSARDLAYMHGRRAEALLRLGDVERERARKLDWYTKGLAAANAGLGVDDQCTDCWFFRGANQARIGQTKGMLDALLGVGDVRASFHAVLKLDPTCQETKLALAHIDQALPGFAGGDVDRAEQAMREIVERQPNFGRALLDLAELLWERGERKQARALVERVIMERAPLHPGEHRKFDSPRATKLLVKFTRE